MSTSRLGSSARTLSSWALISLPSMMPALKVAAGLSFRKPLTALARAMTSALVVAMALEPLKEPPRASKEVSFTARRSKVFLLTRYWALLSRTLLRKAVSLSTTRPLNSITTAEVADAKVSLSTATSAYFLVFSMVSLLLLNGCVDGDRGAHGGGDVHRLHVFALRRGGLGPVDGIDERLGVLFQLFDTEGELADGRVNDAGLIDPV